MKYFITGKPLGDRLIYKFDGELIFARWERGDKNWDLIPIFNIKEKLKDKIIEKIPKAEVALIFGFGL
jgi:hypothetical protein